MLRLLSPGSALCLLLAIGCVDNGVTSAKGAFQLDPASLDFGKVLPGTTTKKSVTITNSGALTIEFSGVVVTGDARSTFHLGDLPGPLAAGAVVQVEVSYTPAAQGTDAAALVVTSSTENVPEARTTLFGITLSPCADGQIECPDTGCVDPQTSFTDCGGCGRACRAGERCRESKCECAPATCGERACGDVTDGCGGTLHCGGCTGDDVCLASTCRAALCVDGTKDGDETDKDCGGSCAGCAAGGACGAGKDCATGLGCVAGACGACAAGAQCAPGLACTGGACIPCASDLQCAIGETCVAGTCARCGDGTRAIDTRIDVKNCGLCGHECAVPAHAPPMCTNGRCGRSVCEQAWFDMDGARTFGCESTCTSHACTSPDGHETPVTSLPLSEAGLQLNAIASGSSLGSAVQTSARYTNEGVLGEPTPPGVGGATEQKNGLYRNYGGLSSSHR